MTEYAASQSPKKSIKRVTQIYFGGGMLTGAQIRAARGLLRWSAQRLADECGLAVGTIQAAERTDEMPTNMLAGSLLAIKTALERGGVEFDGNGGLKLKKGRRK